MSDSETTTDEDVFENAKLTADSGFHTDKNMEMLFRDGIDGYVADNLFRKQDPRFSEYDRYKTRERKERAKRSGRKRLFRTDDFVFPEDLSHCICPTGKKLYRSGARANTNGFLSVRFKGPKSACVPCRLRSQCLRHPERTPFRQVSHIYDKTEQRKQSFTERMKRKIDSVAGRALYSMRLAIGEPPFAHMRYAIGLDRFTLRTKRKVDTQWKLFCIVHNLGKIHRYGAGFA